MMRRGPVWVAVGGVLAWTAWAWAATRQEKMQEIDEDLALTTKLVTPHTAWGRPDPQGPLRALAIVNGGHYMGAWAAPGTILREVVELLARFDLHAQAILVGGKNEFYGESLGQERAERLLTQKYDVFILANYALERLPAKLQYMLMVQVADGSGLVCVGPPAAEFLTPKRRLAELPPALYEAVPIPQMMRQVETLKARAPADKDDVWVADKIVAAYRLKKGRGVHLNFPAHALTPSRPFSYEALADYDYWMLLAGRAVRWAAGRDPEIAVVSVLGPRAAFVQTALPAADQKVTLANRGAKPASVKAALSLRRADGWTHSLGTPEVTIPAGQSVAVGVAIPRLRQDRYFLDVVVRSDRGAEAAGAGAFEVTGSCGVDKVELAASFVERGQTLQGTATLRGPVPDGAVVRVRLRDSYGRVLAQQDQPAKAGQNAYPFQYQADAFATILMRAEAALLVGGEEIAMAQASFTVPKRRRGQFNFLQWDTPTDPLGWYAWEQLKQAGMNTCLVSSFAPAGPQHVLRAADISLVPYSTRILDPKDEQGFMKPCCWNDEPNVTKHVQQIVDNQKLHREHGVWVYSLGDEGVTLGCCVHPACLAAYRRYLKDQYGTIERLNASWEATYQSFDEVDLLDRKENMERGAIDRKLWARWYDRQAFARYNLMQLSRRFVEAYKKLDPEAVTGFEGTGGFGDDLDLITSINTFYTPYPSLADDILRSCSPPGLIRGNWMGYSKAIDPLADAAWRMVIKEMNSIWYWMWTGIGSYWGYLTPTLDFRPTLAELAEEMRPVRQGLGDLLIHSQVVHSGIGIFYSLPSALSHSIENSREFLAPEAAHETWVRYTYDLGLDFRYITSAMLRRGALEPKAFKVLLLPMSQAIAPDEAQAMRAFVEAGGTLIADVRPGIFDEHCKPLAAGALDEVFGIRRSGRDKMEKKDLDWKATLGDVPIGVKMANARTDPGVAPQSAKALAQAGTTPLGLVHTLGAGQAILLNFQLNPTKAGDPDTDSQRALVAALYRRAGVRAPVASTSPEGGPLPLVETRVWRNAEATLVGLWRMMECRWFSPQGGLEAGPPVPAKIVLPEPRHVYDLRAGKYLGQVREIATALRWGRASFFLALPYEIGGIEVELASAKPSAGKPLEAGLRLKVPPEAKARHALFVEVLDPSGRSVLWARQVVLTSGGTAKVQIPIAYNDAAGSWRLKVTELFSGRSAEAGWTIP